MKRSKLLLCVAPIMILAGCGSEATPKPTGRMVVVHEDATSPEAIRGKELMQSRKLLENLAEDVNAGLALPFDVPLVGTQCDEPNAMWLSGDNVMLMCYEWADTMLDIFADTANPPDAAVGAVTATFFHELGHAVIHLFDLPFTGREEDVADQLAATLLLLPEADGTRASEEDRQAALDFAAMWERFSARGELTEKHFADVHSLSRQRMYNFLCWAYGADPDAGASLVDNGSVPEERADSCVEEFDQMSRGWSSLLSSHLKDDDR